MFLLDSILLAPLKGVLWLGHKINDVVDRELNDAGRVKEELMALQMQFEMSQITEQEYTEKERDLLDKLDRLSGPPEEGQDKR
ncbi:MAG: gas vesicle protein GvpG [Planctomycetes bacterium RBG_13_60_9]|nr:MAG: gas vesicle protein GvpG [Planctomycetes bacterium RBG_13_60_9]